MGDGDQETKEDSLMRMKEQWWLKVEQEEHKKHEESVRQEKNGPQRCDGRVMQVFVKTVVSNTLILDAVPSETIEDVKWKILNHVSWSAGDMYVAVEGQLAKESDMVKGCVVDDGSTAVAQESNKSRNKTHRTRSETETARG